MKSIKVVTPAKINLTLEIIDKRPDGFHNISSVMQTVSLFDYLTISVEDCDKREIVLTGNNSEIPYNADNLVYKAAELLLDKANINSKKIIIEIEKNIPVSAGLAGGSSNAAGTLKGLNQLLDNAVCLKELDDLASKLGSDVNFCLYGGTCLATKRGEEIRKLCSAPYINIAIVKPKNLEISAKEAYQKYAAMDQKQDVKHSDKMLIAISQNDISSICGLLNNDLETAIVDNYPEIKKIKDKLIDAGCISAMMSGSGPSVFGIYSEKCNLDCFNSDYDVFAVNSINHGVKVLDQ